MDKQQAVVITLKITLPIILTKWTHWINFWKNTKVYQILIINLWEGMKVLLNNKWRKKDLKKQLLKISFQVLNSNGIDYNI